VRFGRYHQSSRTKYFLTKVAQCQSTKNDSTEQSVIAKAILPGGIVSEAVEALNAAAHSIPLGLHELQDTMTELLTPGAFGGRLKIQDIGNMSPKELQEKLTLLIIMKNGVDLATNIRTEIVGGVHKLTFTT
jgi:hypothetical protein